MFSFYERHVKMLIIKRMEKKKGFNLDPIYADPYEKMFTSGKKHLQSRLDVEFVFFNLFIQGRTAYL